MIIDTTPINEMNQNDKKSKSVHFPTKISTVEKLKEEEEEITPFTGLIVEKNIENIQNKVIIIKGKY